MCTYSYNDEIFWHKLSNFVTDVKEHYPCDVWSTCYITLEDNSVLYFDFVCYLLETKFLYESQIDCRDQLINHLESMQSMKNK